MGSRKWTDEQLRHAVSTERSWRGVMRALGLRSTSSRKVVQHRAARLGLDTTHFSGQRRWSDQDLRQAVENSAAWSEVTARLGLSTDRRSRVRIRGQAVRLGLDIAHLHDRKVEPPPPATELEPPRIANLRNAAPSIVTAWFALRGKAVAVPSEPQAYDLLISDSEGIHRVQVKTTTFEARSGIWQVSIGHRPYSLDKSATKMPYDPKALDYFAVINGDGDLYLIPIRVVAGMTGIYLSAYEEYWVGDVSSLLAGSC